MCAVHMTTDRLRTLIPTPVPDCGHTFCTTTPPTNDAITTADPDTATAIVAVVVEWLVASATDMTKAVPRSRRTHTNLVELSRP